MNAQRFSLEEPVFALSHGEDGEGACPAGRRWRDGPFETETRRFFGAVRQELFTRRAEHPIVELPQLHAAIASCFADWRLLAEGGSPEASPGRFWAPASTRLTVAPGQEADFALETTRFYHLPNGSRRVLAIEEWGENTFRLWLTAPRSQQDDVADELKALAERMKRPHYLQGQVLSAQGCILQDFQACGWDDVALDPVVRAAIELNTSEVIRRREAFRRNGVPMKRGVVLYGPPGTGKTLVAKVLAGLDLATFIYATAADMEAPCRVRATFDLARRLEPTILFFEDIDLFADERSSYSSKAVLGEILAQLDGLKSNDGLIFMATTNDLEAIDPAIRERPSRFDVVLHIGLPSLDARQKILAQNLPAAPDVDTLLEVVGMATEGLSGAQVREVAYLTVQRALLRDACDDNDIVRVEREDVLEAVERVARPKGTGIGFGESVGSATNLTSKVANERRK
ncbi:MAG TPA: ATP-binding protein [Pirellulales bacterium]